MELFEDMFDAADALDRVDRPATLGEPLAGQTRTLLFVLVALRVIHCVVKPDCHDLFFIKRELPSLMQHGGDVLERVVVALWL